MISSEIKTQINNHEEKQINNFLNILKITYSATNTSEIKRAESWLNQYLQKKSALRILRAIFEKFKSFQLNNTIQNNLFKAFMIILDKTLKKEDKSVDLSQNLFNLIHDQQINFNFRLKIVQILSKNSILIKKNTKFKKDLIVKVIRAISNQNKIKYQTFNQSQQIIKEIILYQILILQNLGYSQECFKFLQSNLYFQQNICLLIMKENIKLFNGSEKNLNMIILMNLSYQLMIKIIKKAQFMTEQSLKNWIKQNKFSEIIQISIKQIFNKYLIKFININNEKIIQDEKIKTQSLENQKYKECILNSIIISLQYFKIIISKIIKFNSFNNINHNFVQTIEYFLCSLMENMKSLSKISQNNCQYNENIFQKKQICRIKIKILQFFNISMQFNLFYNFFKENILTIVLYGIYPILFQMYYSNLSYNRINTSQSKTNKQKLNQHKHIRPLLPDELINMNNESFQQIQQQLQNIKISTQTNKQNESQQQESSKPQLIKQAIELLKLLLLKMDGFATYFINEINQQLIQMTYLIKQNNTQNIQLLLCKLQVIAELICNKKLQITKQNQNLFNQKLLQVILRLFQLKIQKIPEKLILKIIQIFNSYSKLIFQKNQKLFSKYLKNIINIYAIRLNLTKNNETYSITNINYKYLLQLNILDTVDNLIKNQDYLCSEDLENIIQMYYNTISHIKQLLLVDEINDKSDFQFIQILFQSLEENIRYISIDLQDHTNIFKKCLYIIGHCILQVYIQDKVQIFQTIELSLWRIIQTILAENNLIQLFFNEIIKILSNIVDFVKKLKKIDKYCQSKHYHLYQQAIIITMKLLKLQNQDNSVSFMKKDSFFMQILDFLIIPFIQNCKQKCFYYDFEIIQIIINLSQIQTNQIKQYQNIIQTFFNMYLKMLINQIPQLMNKINKQDQISQTHNFWIQILKLTQYSIIIQSILINFHQSLSLLNQIGQLLSFKHKFNFILGNKNDKNMLPLLANLYCLELVTLTRMYSNGSQYNQKIFSLIIEFQSHINNTLKSFNYCIKIALFSFITIVQSFSLSQITQKSIINLIIDLYQKNINFQRQRNYQQQDFYQDHPSICNFKFVENQIINQFTKNDTIQQMQNFINSILDHQSVFNNHNSNKINQQKQDFDRTYLKRYYNILNELDQRRKLVIKQLLQQEKTNLIVKKFRTIRKVKNQ